MQDYTEPAVVIESKKTLQSKITLTKGLLLPKRPNYEKFCRLVAAWVQDISIFLSENSHK
jgi:hypothetical protein